MQLNFDSVAPRYKNNFSTLVHIFYLVVITIWNKTQASQLSLDKLLMPCGFFNIMRTNVLV